MTTESTHPRWPVLRALEVTEERELAGRVAGLMYLLGAATVLLLLLIPGVTADTPIVLAAAGVCFAWAGCCFFLIPWRRVKPVVSHFSSAMGLVITIVTMAATGGAHSPARLYLFFVVVYAAYFYPPREAIPHLVGCLIVLALPFAYDPAAVEGAALGESLILAPTFLMLGALIMGGKGIMLELSRNDPLTGLVNRRVFEQRLAEAALRRRQSDRFGLMLCDLDSFKDVNTHHGHPEGDRVLRLAAEALLSSVRGGDLVARLGGDEFAIVAVGADDEAMAALAERICLALREANRELRLRDFKLAASFGWALFPDETASTVRLVAAADVAMRAAKESGRRSAHSSLAPPAPALTSSS